MDSHAHARYERMPFFLWGYTALLLVAGLLLGPLSQLPAGLSKIILTETALITDYVLVAAPRWSMPRWSRPSVSSFCKSLAYPTTVLRWSSSV